MFAIMVLVLARAGELYGVGPWDRNAVLAALDERAQTGIPRHLDHDDGQALQEAVTAALIANPTDGEIASAAMRASFPVVPSVSPVIYDSMPSIDVEMFPAFTLPWKITADVTIDASVDGSRWQRAIDVPRAAGQIAIPLEKLFPRAGRPGFHAVRLRASLRFNGEPGFLPSGDARDLPVLTYGVVGASAAGQRVATILNSAARATANDLVSSLPRVPLDTWLRTIAVTRDGPTVYWTGQWCEARIGADDDQHTSICARAIVGSSPDGGHAELWVKVATVDASGPKPTWTTVPPTVEGLDLIANLARSSGDLGTLPFTLRANSDQWPRAALRVDPRAITFSPELPRPGEPVTIAMEVRNTGTSDLFGARIDVIVADNDSEPALAHRQFVRSIEAGGSVTVKTDARFPRGYGVVEAMVLANSHGALGTLLDGENGSRAAWRIVRPELAPPGFVERMGAAIGCKPDCPEIR